MFIDIITDIVIDIRIEKSVRTSAGEAEQSGDEAHTNQCSELLLQRGLRMKYNGKYEVHG